MRRSKILCAGIAFALAACSSTTTTPPAPKPTSTPLAGVYAANVADIHGLGPAHVRVSLYESGGKIDGVFIIHARPWSKLGQPVFVDRVSTSSVTHQAGGTLISGTLNLGGKLGTMTFSGGVAGGLAELQYRDAAGVGNFNLPLVSGYHPVYAEKTALTVGARTRMDDGGPPPVTQPGTYTVSAAIPVWTSTTIAQPEMYQLGTTIQKPCSLPNPNGSTQFSVSLSDPQPITDAGPWPYFPQYTYTGAVSGSWQFGSNQPWVVPDGALTAPADYDGDFMMTADTLVPGVISQPSYTEQTYDFAPEYVPVTNSLSGYYTDIEIDTDMGGITGQVQTIPGINLTSTPSLAIGLLSTSWFAGSSPTDLAVCGSSGNVTITGPQ